MTFLAQSLARPSIEGKGGQPPDAAVITTTNYPVYQGRNLPVPQWISTVQFDPRAAPGTFSWLQARLNDDYNFAQIIDPNLAAVLSTVSGYSVDGTLSGGGQAIFKRGAAQLQISINPYFNQDRLDSAAGGKCGVPAYARALTESFYHEARHAYQNSLTNTTNYPNNDEDKDNLLNAIPIGPTDFLLDTSTRTTQVCNELTDDIETITFKGPSNKDAWGSLTKNGTGVKGVSWAIEMDAWAFSVQH